MSCVTERCKSPGALSGSVCVFITAGPITKLFAGGGGGEWRTCAMRDDEPRPVWMSGKSTLTFKREK